MRFFVDPIRVVAKTKQMLPMRFEVNHRQLVRKLERLKAFAHWVVVKR
jgi:hypothetical protein